MKTIRFSRLAMLLVLAGILALAAVFNTVTQAQSPAQRQSNGIIVFYTDWGTSDFYVGAVKGVALSIFREATLIDLTHDVPPFQLSMDAVELLRVAAHEFPTGTVFVAVVDPGVGTERRPIVVHTEDDKFFVGPDNGLFTPMIQAGVQAIYEITNESYMRPGPRSHTFHGRDIFTPTGANLAAGRPVEAVGPEVTDPILLDIGLAEVEDDTLVGEVLIIDQYGNLGTNIYRDLINQLELQVGDMLQVTIGDESFEVPLVNTYGDVPEGDDLVYISSRDALSIAVNWGSAEERWGAEVGSVVTVQIVDAE
jgi:S-adenosyl-L-methionine hydrolase (adenosine-forming)